MLLDFDIHPDELIVDSFAGGGGPSEGIRLALGRDPDIAINHDGEALAMHRANHPGTRHLNHNIWKVDPIAATGGKRVGLLWASPDCKHHSKAKGGKPREQAIRDLAWVVVRWAKQVRPRVILLENVEEFRKWGPLDKDGRPCAARSGQTFDAWCGELRRLGYRVEHRELRACDYGAPTIRKRLFLVARCDGKPIRWPEPTHAAPGSVEVLAGLRQPWRTAAEIIDWSLPCHSIFLSAEEGRAVGANRPLADKTMSRIAKGVKRYVLDAASPFIVETAYGEPRNGSGSRSLDAPMATLTATVGHGLVTPFITSYYGTKVEGGERVADLDAPLPTVTTAHRFALATAFVAKSNHGDKPHYAADEPVHTVMAGGTHHAVVAAFMGKLAENGAGVPADEPLHTVMAGAPRHYVTAAYLAQHNLGNVGREAGEPVSTVTATGSQQTVVAALLDRQFGASTGAAVDAPVGTVTCVNKTSVVAAFLAQYYGADGDPAVTDPLHTVTTRDRHAVVTVDLAGVPHAIVDIGMRMLAPRELFRAQGFPDAYVIETGIGPDGAPVRLTRTAQVRMCGNSVVPLLAKALVEANLAPAPAKVRRAPAPLPLFADLQEAA
ncbi:hypothetical protein AFCDBAGC_3721 [Methylobacterium cerastii]|uniref:DNA (cytosine-5-)-methyltransferase n=1 Tax=Methylobacterium cerastii TaxID=932741 RepID=A0ABQ4QM64_9HYPH|nr:DNA cytosine methyltransferase [Methylobacterium cerastii]GJD45844.1 hypothetical protein AFCDBAGC_3721 [Methylobacterium cerastii]